MRKHTLLAAISLALGASTLWLAIELHRSQQEVAELRSAASVVPTTAPIAFPATDMHTTEFPAITAEAAPAPGQSGGPPDTTQSHNDAAMRAANLAHNAWVKSWLDDPAKRAKVLADMRKAQVRDSPRHLLDLDDDVYNRLLDTQAASQLRYAEAMSRCNMESGCDILAASHAQAQINRSEIAALLGEEKAQRLETYHDNVMERNSVSNFSNELPDAIKLTDAQAEKLANAFGEERRRIVREWEQQGEQISGIANLWGSLSYPSMRNADERLAQAMEFQRRQRDRAAGILTSAQLDALTRQQEQMLEIVRGSWEIEEPARESR